MKEPQQHPRFRHGASGGKSRLYGIWQAMKNRCRNPNQWNYQYYGARGIRVCDEWQAFEPFRVWAESNGYSDSMSIERADTDGNYEPSNCSWIPVREQPGNTSRIIWVEVDGQRMRLKDAAKLRGLTYSTVTMRVRRGWSVERALGLQ